MGRHSYAPGCAGKSGGGGAVRESRVDPVGSTLNGNGAAASPAFPLPLPGESIGEEKAKVKLDAVSNFFVRFLHGEKMEVTETAKKTNQRLRRERGAGRWGLAGSLGARFDSAWSARRLRVR